MGPHYQKCPELSLMLSGLWNSSYSLPKGLYWDPQMSTCVSLTSKSGSWVQKPPVNSQMGSLELLKGHQHLDDNTSKLTLNSFHQPKKVFSNSVGRALIQTLRIQARNPVFFMPSFPVRWFSQWVQEFTLLTCIHGISSWSYDPCVLFTCGVLGVHVPGVPFHPPCSFQKGVSGNLPLLLKIYPDKVPILSTTTSMCNHCL